MALTTHPYLVPRL